ncbi:MAG: adenylate/guanylate cyclase domain-containing protein [Rhodospirillum sp.]|nr:adenylate/guanylate cyclase domain-containing protein [Rhodospirillum sp.]
MVWFLGDTVARNRDKDEATDLETPFPLKRRFNRTILPFLLGLLAALVVAGSYATRHIVEEVYVQQALGQADAMERTLRANHPRAWAILAEESVWKAAPEAGDLDDLDRAIHSALNGGRIGKLKIYDTQGRILYSTTPEDIGRIEHDAPLLGVIREGTPRIVLKATAESAQYELFVRHSGDAEHPGLVFEFYEPASYLNALIWRNTVWPVATLGSVLLLMLLVLTRLVDRAQKAIDARTNALAGVTRRLERFVSAGAVRAALTAAGGEGETRSSRLMDYTLFYSDVRDFTGLAETTPPDQVVAFLNRLVTIQVDLIHAHGGDVDKMIGDAVLGIFEGPDRAARAVEAARAILARLEEEVDILRPLRIGLHDGFVIAGAIGPEDRQDFTVIGDSVNVAARLCDAARAGEVVADTRTLARAGHPVGFGPVEEISVKGRREQLSIRRCQVGQPD